MAFKIMPKSSKSPASPNTLRIVTSGGSCFVVIPKPAADHLDITKGDFVEVWEGSASDAGTYKIVKADGVNSRKVQKPPKSVALHVAVPGLRRLVKKYTVCEWRTGADGSIFFTVPNMQHLKAVTKRA